MSERHHDDAATVRAGNTPVDAEDVFADRIRQASATAANRVIAQAAPDADFEQLIHDTLQAGFDAAGKVLGDYMLFGNTPVEDRPAMLARSGWPTPETWSDEAQPFTRERAEETLRRLAAQDDPATPRPPHKTEHGS